MRRLVLIASGAVLAASAHAQDARTLVRWSAPPTAVSSEGEATVRLTGEIAPGWKLYALTTPSPAPALRVTVDTAAARLGGAVRHDRAPVAAFDSLLGVPVEQFTGRVGVVVPLAGVDAAEVPLSVRFAVCDAAICLAPRTVVVPVALRAAPRQKPDAAPPDAAPPVVAPSVPALPAPSVPATSPDTIAPASPAGSVEARVDSVAPTDSMTADESAETFWPAWLLGGVAALAALAWAVRRRA